MKKSAFRDNISPFGNMKYIHQDYTWETYYTWVEPPYFFARIPLPGFALASDDTTAETLPARSIIQIKSMHVRGVLKCGDHSTTTYQMLTTPVRLDLVMEDQTYLGQIAERSNTSDLSNFYLRERDSIDTEKKIDITSSINAPLDTESKGHALVHRQQHLVLEDKSQTVFGNYKAEPYQYIDFEVDLGNCIFEIPDSDIIAGVTSLESCVGRMPSLYLVFMPNALHNAGSFAWRKNLMTGRFTISYAVLDNMGVSTY